MLALESSESKQQVKLLSRTPPAVGLSTSVRMLRHSIYSSASRLATLARKKSLAGLSSHHLQGRQPHDFTKTGRTVRDKSNHCSELSIPPPIHQHIHNHWGCILSDPRAGCRERSLATVANEALLSLPIPQRTNTSSQADTSTRIPTTKSRYYQSIHSSTSEATTGLHSTTTLSPVRLGGSDIHTHHPDSW